MSIHNSKKFDDIAGALKKQHSKIQFSHKSSMSPGHGGKGKGKGYGKTRHGQGYPRSSYPRPSAHVARIDDWSEDHEAEDHYIGDASEDHYTDTADDHSWDWYVKAEAGASAWISQGSDWHIDQYDGDVDPRDEEGDEVDDEILATELWTMAEIDEREAEDDNQIAQAVQNMTVASIAMVSLRGNGSRKGKGKGRGKRRFSTGRSNLSLEERKWKLSDLKKKTRCTACERSGIGLEILNARQPEARGKAKARVDLAKAT